MSVMTKDQLSTMIKEIMVQEAGAISEPQLDMIEKLVNGKLAEYSATAEKKFQLVGDTTVNDKTAGFESLADFLRSVYKADKSKGRVFDQRLLTKTAGSPSQNENDMEAGGYLVPEEYRNTLLQLALEKSDIMARCTMIPMATNSINIPIINGFDHSGGLVHGGVQFLWVDEEADFTAKPIKFARVHLMLKKVAGLIYMSDEIMEDSPISMAPLVQGAFSDALVWTLEDVVINGTGAGKPLGILNAPCKISVAKETGQAAATLVTENVVKMYARMWNYKNAVWMASRSIIPQLFTMSLAVGTGGVPVYLPANGLSGSPYSTLFGLPIIFSEHCRALGTEGDIYLVDFSQYLIGQKSANPVKTASSIHVQFLTEQTCYRMSMRLDGQSWWSSALTPHYSTNTVSPIVTLAARA